MNRRRFSISVGQLDRIRPAPASQALRFDRDVDIGAEFLRLHERAPGQRCARDAGREAQIVLDLRTRSGLPAESARLDHQHIQSLGRRVDSGREPGRAGADHHEVVDCRYVDRRIHAEVTGDVGDSRILEHPAATADDHRNFIHRDVKAVEQSLHVRIVVDIDIDVRVGIAREEFAQPERVRRVPRPEQHHLALPGRHESHAAENEGAHHDFAQLGVDLNDVAQVRFVYRQDRAGLAHANAGESGDTAQGADLPRKVARAEHIEHDLAAQSRQRDLEAAGEDDQEPVVAPPGFCEHLAHLRLEPLAVRLQARDLRARELGKHLLPAFVK
jgi:hypothetical protein